MYPSPPPSSLLESEAAVGVDLLDPAKLHLDPAGWKVPEKKVDLPTVQDRRARRFIAPMPLTWFLTACRLPGKAPVLAVVIWHLARLKKSDTFVLTQASLNQFGISRQAKYKALAALESVGLISVRRRGRKNPE